MNVLKNLTDFTWMSQPGAWIGLLTLVVLEIVLGIDNIVFISILSGKLKPEEQAKGRKTGMILAVIPRLILLLMIPIVLSFEHGILPLPFADPSHPDKKLSLSVQDLVVLLGGIFLMYKSTHEIHQKLEGEEGHGVEGGGGKGAAFAAVMGQIMVLNIVFSLDSIVTAIGMVPKEQVLVMILAVLISTAIMAVTVNPVSRFVEKHPTVKMLALSFLLLIGTTLIVEAFHVHLPKGYVYFAMGFSVFVELLNVRASSKKKNRVVQFNEPHLSDVPGEETR
jgi:predicted tellurium resistance membrane protein TerC